MPIFVHDVCSECHGDGYCYDGGHEFSCEFCHTKGYQIETLRQPPEQTLEAINKYLKVSEMSPRQKALFAKYWASYVLGETKATYTILELASILTNNSSVMNLADLNRLDYAEKEMKRCGLTANLTVFYMDLCSVRPSQQFYYMTPRLKAILKARGLFIQQMNSVRHNVQLVSR